VEVYDHSHDGTGRYAVYLQRVTADRYCGPQER